MRCPQFEYALVKHRPKKDIAAVEYDLAKISLECAKKRLLYHKAEELFHQELIRLHTLFADKMRPYIQVLEAGRCKSALKIKMKWILTEIGQVCDLNIAVLKRELVNQNEEINKMVGTQLDESIPEFDEIGNLTGEELSKLVQQWKDAENYLRSLEAKYIAFETEWSSLRKAYFDKIKDAYELLEMIQEVDTDVQEN